MKEMFLRQIKELNEFGLAYLKRHPFSFTQGKNGHVAKKLLNLNVDRINQHELSAHEKTNLKNCIRRSPNLQNELMFEFKFISLIDSYVHDIKIQKGANSNFYSEIYRILQVGDEFKKDPSNPQTYEIAGITGYIIGRGMNTPAYSSLYLLFFAKIDLPKDSGKVIKERDMNPCTERISRKEFEEDEVYRVYQTPWN